MHIGFTGTQLGMQPNQLQSFLEILNNFDELHILHHGDCRGADEQAHNEVKKLGWDVILHPPVNSNKRAFCQSAFSIRAVKDYIARNHDIVDNSVLLLATPATVEEVLRSGTWATIRYANVKGVEFIIIDPLGNLRKTI